MYSRAHSRPSGGRRGQGRARRDAAFFLLRHEIMASVQGGRALEGLRILLVEDAEDIRDVLELLLQADGADVRAVGSANAAVEAAAAWSFDILLTDLGL